MLQLQLSITFVTSILLQVVKGNLLWRQVMVDEVWFQNPLILINTFSSSHLECNTACKYSACRNYCYDGQICNLTYLVVSPLHVATNTGGVRMCYTSEPKDFIVGSIASQSSIHGTKVNRIASNFARGLYNYDDETCAGGGYYWEPWQLFDMKETKVIHQVRVTSQSFNYNPDLPNNLQVRVGKTAPATAGDFSNYKLFGTLPSSTAANTTYVLKSERGIKGQFLSIQKPNGGELVICMVQAL